MEQIDTRLERAPRYVAAKQRYTELQLKFNALERERDDVQTQINLCTTTVRNKIDQQAAAMLTGAPVPVGAGKDGLSKTYEELTHQLAVHRSAVSMQKQIVDELRSEVGAAIAKDLAPQHLANVRAIFKAAMQLSAAIEVEHELRDGLNVRNVPYSTHIMPMSFPSFGRLSDPNSRVSNFVLEAYEFDFITFAEVPDNLKDCARAKKAKPSAPPAQAPAVAAARDDWLGR